MQGAWVQGAEEKPPGTRCSAAYIGMNTAISADMCQNNPMPCGNHQIATNRGAFTLAQGRDA